MAEFLDGKAVAAEVRTEVAKGVAELKEWDIPVRLDVILVGEDPAFVTYVSSKERDSAEVDITPRFTTSLMMCSRKCSPRSSGG